MVLLNWCVFRFLLPLLLQYDSTAEESDITEAHGVGASVQTAKNMHAMLSSQALSRLSGMVSGENPTPYNQAAADALIAMLTPKLASMLKDQVSKDLLSKLNSNLETPEVRTAVSFFLTFMSTGMCKQYDSRVFCIFLTIILCSYELKEYVYIYAHNIHTRNQFTALRLHLCGIVRFCNFPQDPKRILFDCNII